MEYKVNMPEGLFSQLFEALNPDVVDDVRAVNKMVCSYSADSMLVYDAQDQKHYSIAFSVNTDEAGVSTVALGESVEVSVLTLDGNAQNEYNALFTEGNTYASVKEQLDNYAETVANQEATINDFNEKDYPGQIETLNSKLATYEAAEAERINAAKDALINEYSESVDPEVIQDVTDHKDNFSYEEIEAKLAVNFSRKMRSSGGKIPSAHDEPSDPTLNVLNKYMNSKRGNK